MKENWELAYEDYKKGLKRKEIAEKYNVSINTVKSWKTRHWNKMDKKEGAPPKKKRGAPLGNKNATGPPGNKHAEKHGFFSKWLPEETQQIIGEMPTNEIDTLWMNIQLQFAAIIRAQKLMYVHDQQDKTVEKFEEKDGNVVGERWEVQQAWDKQASFLQAQAKAQRELTSMIRQYEELLHKNWKLATKEQKARIEQLKARTEQIKGADQNPIEDKVQKLFDTIGGMLDESE